MNQIDENLVTPQKKKPGEAVRERNLRIKGNQSDAVGASPVKKVDKGTDKRFAPHKGSYGEETEMTAAAKVIESAIDGEAMDVIDAIDSMMRTAAYVAVRGEIEEEVEEEFSTEGLTEEVQKLYEFATTLSPNDTYAVEGHINDWRNHIDRSRGHQSQAEYHANCADGIHPEKDVPGLIPQHRAAAELHDQLAQVYAGMADSAFAQAKNHVKKVRAAK